MLLILAFYPIPVARFHQWLPTLSGLRALGFKGSPTGFLPNRKGLRKYSTSSGLLNPPLWPMYQDWSQWLPNRTILGHRGRKSPSDLSLKSSKALAGSFFFFFYSRCPNTTLSVSSILQHNDKKSNQEIQIFNLQPGFSVRAGCVKYKLEITP